MESKIDLSPEEMRQLGYRVIDMLVEHYESLEDKPVVRVASRREAEADLAEPPPEKASDPETVLETCRELVFSRMAHVTHPRFFAFVPGPSNFVGVLGDALASGFNVFAGSWLASSGPSALELVTIDWLRQMLGFPEGAGGLFTSGGSAANLIALAAARHDRLGDGAGALEGATAYFSDQTHSAAQRAFRILGFGSEALRPIPTGADRRLSLKALRRALDEDRRAGRRPFCVVANAGTFNTGTVDPLVELAELCRAEGLWLHADGAYGAAAALTPRGREALVGIDQLDSLALDPHKWLFQPFEIGCVLVRDRRRLLEAFTVHPEYLEDLDLGLDEVNFCDHGVQLTRGFRALKLWLSFKIFGVEAFRSAVERGLELAEAAEGMLAESSSWEVASPARLGIVTFRYAPERLAAELGPEGLDRLQRQLVEDLRDDGFAFLTSTILDGRTVLRLCTINPRTRTEDLRHTLERLEALAERRGAVP